MKAFGNLAHIRGILYFRLSPHEQKAFAGIIQKTMNVVPRTLMTLPYWMPALVSGVGIYYFVEESYRLSKRKDPKDYIDECDPNLPAPE